jgi:hypothetical protein
MCCSRDPRVLRLKPCTGSIKPPTTAALTRMPPTGKSMDTGSSKYPTTTVLTRVPSKLVNLYPLSGKLLAALLLYMGPPLHHNTAVKLEIWCAGEAALADNKAYLSEVITISVSFHMRLALSKVVRLPTQSSESGSSTNHNIIDITGSTAEIRTVARTRTCTTI